MGAGCNGVPASQPGNTLVTEARQIADVWLPTQNTIGLLVQPSAAPGGSYQSVIDCTPDGSVLTLIVVVPTQSGANEMVVGFAVRPLNDGGVVSFVGVGAGVGVGDGVGVGPFVGVAAGPFVGVAFGDAVGRIVGVGDGVGLGAAVGASVGAAVAGTGRRVGEGDGL
jgi:hypothetical protein